jgi:hypothetical protein
MTSVILLAIVGWLPGAVLFHVPWADRDRRAALASEERQFWAVVLSVAVSLTIVLTLAALHRYSFTRLLIADVVAAAALAAASRFDLWLGPAAPRMRLTACIPIALALLGVARFFPSSEYVIGGKDPGVYVNVGVQIAQRGTLVYHDPVVAAVPPFARDLFIPADRNRPDEYLGARFMGVFVLTPDTGAEVSQFPHLFPASIAIGYGIGGLAGARRVIGVWGILGVLAVYFLGSRLAGRPAATAAAALLALNVVQVWFARYPNADIVMQALVFAALLATARQQVDDDPFFAPVAGGLLGLLLFLRFDSLVATACVVAAALLGAIVRQRVRWTFFAPLALAAGLCVLYSAGPMREYFLRPRLFLEYLKGWQYGALAAGGAALVGAAVAGRRSPRLADRIKIVVPAAITIVVVALAVYALEFRHPGGKLTDYDAYSLRTFAQFYFTVPALLAALIGFALVMRARFWDDPAFVLVLTAFSLLLFYKIRIVPEHFWAARRFVAVILPGALLCAAAAALTGVRGRLLFTRMIRTPIGVVFLALLAIHYARAAGPILDHVEYQGIAERLEQLSKQIGDRDLLVVESRDAGSDVHVFALPLSFIYARNVLTLSNARPDKVTFAAFLDQMHARYDRVLFLGGGGTDLLSSRWSVAPVASERFQVPEYDSPRNEYPRSIKHKEFDYSLYAFGPAPAEPAPAVLDVGVNDDLNVNRFHAKEQTEGRTIRWSQRQSVVIVNPISGESRTVALWMSSGGRPASAPPADVTVLLNDIPIGTVRVENGFREYDLDLPAHVASDAAATREPVRIMLRTTTWNPMRTLGTSDDRDLGVMVDRVAVR